MDDKLSDGFFKELENSVIQYETFDRFNRYSKTSLKPLNLTAFCGGVKNGMVRLEYVILNYYKNSYSSIQIARITFENISNINHLTPINKEWAEQKLDFDKAVNYHETTPKRYRIFKADAVISKTRPDFLGELIVPGFGVDSKFHYSLRKGMELHEGTPVEAILMAQYYVKDGKSSDKAYNLYGIRNKEGEIVFEQPIDNPFDRKMLLGFIPPSADYFAQASRMLHEKK